MISIITSKEPDKNWNNRLLESELGTIYQTVEQSVHNIHEGRSNIFLQFLGENKEILGQLLITTHPRFNKTGSRNFLLSKTPFLKQNGCYWNYGPIIFNKKFTSEIYQSLSNFLQKNKYVGAGWLHPFSTNDVPANLFKLKKWSTFIIDLKQSEDQIYNNIDNHSGRKNIQRSIKRNVIIETISDDNFLDYSLLRMKELGVTPTKNELDKRFEWWMSVKLLGYSGFLAKKDNIPVGGILFSSFSKHILEVGVARSKKDTDEHLYSQDLLKWSIIKWGINNDMKYYNLSGINPNPESKKEEGIFRYKKKWGGKQYNFWRLFFK
jgi:lipid II:glycine glycyltransferase (peptidoglycan interpeptide bridge formation enzyme)